ncbi:ABC transporter permease [Fertoebacter nigrum]|uniref:ABC transporter permease n=1 Tax=Fertoeibacter niger TaxID=2656921 RepID=A0A8X8H167_9RHOB|nr:ABC transporter permease [Fertoeibacter niger]NUB44252.1 ABC transporter permease [Fertoeibacter niger]
MAVDAKTASSFEEGLKGASEKVAEFKEDKGLLKRLQHWLHQTPSAVPMIVLVVALIIFGVLSENFFKAGTLSTILQQIAIVGILGCAQSIVVLTAGIDLSVGAIAVFSSVLMGQMSFRYGIPAEVSIAIGLVLGTAMGAVNGFLIAKMKLPPFIVTLGTWQVLLASNFIFSANETIRSSDVEAQAPALGFWGGDVTFWGVPMLPDGSRPDLATAETVILTTNAAAGTGVKVLYAVFLMIALVAVMAYVLRHTAWGRHVYATGDDPQAAELAGVPTQKVLIQVYALAGLFCAIAGWVMIGRFGSVSPTASTGQLGNIQSITAVVIGGISLFGGRGSIVGMFFGALIVGVFEMGLRLVGTDPQWTFFLIGVLIIFAVAVDQWIRKAAA